MSKVSVTCGKPDCGKRLCAERGAVLLSADEKIRDSESSSFFKPL